MGDKLGINPFADFPIQSDFPAALRFYKSIWKRSLVYDYNPADYHGLMIGSHWEIFQLKEDATPPVGCPQYLMHWLEIGQKEFMGPGHVETEEYCPLQADFAKHYVKMQQFKDEIQQRKREEGKTEEGG